MNTHQLKCDLGHNDRMLLSRHVIIPEHIDMAMNGLRTIGVEKSRTLDSVHLTISYSLSRIESVTLDINELQQNFQSNSDDLLGYTPDKRRCVVLQMDASDGP
jgi:hypothetical protein